MCCSLERNDVGFSADVMIRSALTGHFKLSATSMFVRIVEVLWNSVRSSIAVVNPRYHTHICWHAEYDKMQFSYCMPVPVRYFCPVL